jgi:iron complex outermembrane receptor protein
MWFKTPLLAALLLCSAVLSSLVAQPAEKRPFNLPAEPAEKSLDAFSAQSGVGLVVNSTVLDGIQTNPVQGDFTPGDALRLMLANTGLAATRDEKSGAFVVRREEASPNGASRSQPSLPGAEEPATGRAAQDGHPARPDTDEVVNLDAFHVTTTLGKYQESSTSTATKSPAEIKDIPASIQVLNASFIADIRATSLEDLYPYVVGMNREGTTVTGFTMRGFSNSNPDITLNNVQTDGLPGVASRWGSPTTANVERVDIPKGPSSVLYGPLNPGGFVNIITKNPQRTAFSSLYTEISSFAGAGLPSVGADTLSYRATADTTGPIGSSGHFFYRFIASVEDLASFRGNGYFKNHYFFPSLTYQLDQNTDFTAKIEVTRQTRNSDSGLVAPFYNTALVASRQTLYQDQGPGDDEYDNGEVYTLFMHHHFGGNWTASVSLRDTQHRDGRSLFENNGVISPLVSGVPDVANAEVVRRFRHLQNYRKYNLVDANLSGTVGPEDVRQTLLLGAAYSNEVQDIRGLTNGPNSNAATSINVYHPDLTIPPFPAPGLGPADNVQRFYNYGVYASDQVKLLKHLIAAASLRYDTQDSNYNEYVLHRHEQQSVHSAVPSFGVVYEPNDTVSLYADYALSFRPSEPVFVDVNGNAGFPSEKAHQVETGIKFSLPQPNLTATFALYDIVKHNVTEAVAGVLLANGLQTYAVSGKQESKGFEAQVDYQPLPNWQVQLGYTYIDARVTASVIRAEINTPLFNVPHNDFSLWTRYNFTQDALKGLGVGLGEIYVGHRVGGYPTVTAAGTYQAGIMAMASYAKTNLALFYRWRRYDLALNIGNVFDRQYLNSIRNVITVVPGDPRKLTLSARIPF